MIGSKNGPHNCVTRNDRFELVQKLDVQHRCAFVLHEADMAGATAQVARIGRLQLEDLR